MNFIAVGDITEPDSLDSLLNLNLEEYAFLLLTGDMAGSPDGWKIGKARASNDASFIPHERNPKEYYQELLEPSVEKLKKVDSYLAQTRKHLPIFAIYGNTDFKSVVSKAQPKNFFLLHKSFVQVEDMFLVGYNGHPMYPWEIQNPGKKDVFGYTYAETANELNSFKEEDLYEDLTFLCRSLQNRNVIVLTHTPPYRILDKVKPELIEWAKSSYGETAKEGNVGSTGLREFIMDYQPLLSIFGHIHESKGIQKVGETTCINVGSFGENREFLLVQISNGKISSEFKRLS